MSLAQSMQNPSQSQLLQTISNQIAQSIQLLTRLVNRQGEPRVFLKSNNQNLLSNTASGIILQGMTIPNGHKGVVKDFNVNFSTLGGTVQFLIVDNNGNTIVPVTTSISSSASGAGDTVLEAGESLAIVGQSSGAGQFGVYCSGYLHKVE